MQTKLDQLRNLNVYFKNRGSFTDEESIIILQQSKQDPISNEDKVYI